MVSSRADAVVVFFCDSTAGLTGAFAVVSFSLVSSIPAVEVFVSTEKSQAVRGEFKWESYLLLLRIARERHELYGDRGRLLHHPAVLFEDLKFLRVGFANRNNHAAAFL